MVQVEVISFKYIAILGMIYINEWKSTPFLEKMGLLWHIQISVCTANPVLCLFGMNKEGERLPPICIVELICTHD